jgi:hypothetical protein
MAIATTHEIFITDAGFTPKAYKCEPGATFVFKTTCANANFSVRARVAGTERDAFPTGSCDLNCPYRLLGDVATGSEVELSLVPRGIDPVDNGTGIIRVGG